MILITLAKTIKDKNNEEQFVRTMNLSLFNHFFEFYIFFIPFFIFCWHKGMSVTE